MFDSHRELFLMLSVKADANRKHTKLENKAFIFFVLLLSYLVNFTARFFLISKNTYTGSELENKKNLIVKKLASEQLTRKMILTCSFRGAA